MIGGQTAVSGHIKIADDVKIAGQSGIASDINIKVQLCKVLWHSTLKNFKGHILFLKNYQKCTKL